MEKIAAFIPASPGPALRDFLLFVAFCLGKNLTPLLPLHRSFTEFFAAGFYCLLHPLSCQITLMPCKAVL
jgi:hypothetical protein